MAGHCSTRQPKVVQPFTQDLLLACKLAKMDTSLLGLNEDGAGSPRKVRCTASNSCRIAPARSRRFRRSPTHEEPAEPGEELASLNAGGQPVSLMQAMKDERVSLRATDEDCTITGSTSSASWNALLRVRRAFRLIDEDSSGSADRSELKFMLNAMFNLSIPSTCSIG